MSRLENLKANLLTMSQDDLMAKLREIRDDRKISKKSDKTTTAIKKERSSTKAKKILESLSVEQIAEAMGMTVEEVQAVMGGGDAEPVPG